MRAGVLSNPPFSKIRRSAGPAPGSKEGHKMPNGDQGQTKQSLTPEERGTVAKICACCGKIFQYPDDGHIGVWRKEPPRFCGECDQRLSCPSDSATDDWNKLINPPFDKLPSEGAKNAVSRFLQTTSGSSLIHDLNDLLAPNGVPKTKINMSFVDKLPNQDAGGSFFPPQPYPADGEETDPEALKNFSYAVKIENQPDYSGDVMSRSFPPSSIVSALSFNYSFTDGGSEMAATIDHELLHIWFVNKFYSVDNTGHGPDGSDPASYDPTFFDRLRKFYGDMDKLEQCLKKYAKRQK